MKVATFPFTANGKAHGLGDPTGFVKLIADTKYGELLGGHLIGPDVSELLPELTLAQKWDLTVNELARNVHTHPTLSRSAAGGHPRPRRAHDQLLRPAIWVAGIGGLVVGHILWLAGHLPCHRHHDDQHLGADRRSASVVGAMAACSAGGRTSASRRALRRFCWCLPVSPVLLSLIVLGVTYL